MTFRNFTMVICKMIHVILVLLSSLALTRCKIIPGGSCDVKKMAENDALTLMKVRELMLELSPCKENSLATERLLYDLTSRLEKTERQCSADRNKSTEKQRELERQQRDVSARLIRTETEFSNYRNESIEKRKELERQQRDVSARLIKTETEFATYRNESHEKQSILESELQMTKDRLNDVVNFVGMSFKTGKHIHVSHISYYKCISITSFLGHRSRRLQLLFVITCCPASFRRPFLYLHFSTSSPEPLDGY